MVQPVVPLLDQFYYFALTILIGMIAGFCYDLYKVTRGTLRLRKIGTALGDVLFWLILTGLVFLLLLLGNWGEVRLYVLLGLALGALIYLNLCSRRTTTLLQWFFKAMHRLLQGLWKGALFIWQLFCLPFKGIYLLVAIPLSITLKIAGKVMRGGKWLLNKCLLSPGRKVRVSLRKRFSTIFPIFEYKDKE